MASSFHGSSLLLPLCILKPHLPVHLPSCSLQSNVNRKAALPINERHISSPLASSLLRQQMQTPQGDALMAMANHLLPPGVMDQAVSRQLELLAAATPASSSQKDDLLSRRIAELKQITHALQDIIFVHVSSRILHTVLAPFPSHLDDRLQAIHHPDVHPLIERHVALVINGNNHSHPSFNPQAFAQVCKLEMGKIYAASVMHGYFLARVHQRFQLERALKLEVSSMGAYMQGDAFKDEEALHCMSSMTCEHTVEVIERLCRALFGEACVRMHRKPLHANITTTFMNIQMSNVKSLIIHALAFGALLWDEEQNFVPQFYPI